MSSAKIKLLFYFQYLYLLELAAIFTEVLQEDLVSLAGWIFMNSPINIIFVLPFSPLPDERRFLLYAVITYEWY